MSGWGRALKTVIVPGIRALNAPKTGLEHLKGVAAGKENAILSKFTEIHVIPAVDQIENRSFDGGCSIGPRTMIA